MRPHRNPKCRSLVLLLCHCLIDGEKKTKQRNNTQYVDADVVVFVMSVHEFIDVTDDHNNPSRR